LLGDELVVAAAYVDEGPTIKRWRARARGRVARIKKRTCHVTLRLVPAETDTQTLRPRRQQAEAAETPEPTEEKPKRATRARRTTTSKAEAAEKPKRTRTRRTKRTESEES
jgi:large subunit ribosomal protein L22